MQEQDDDAMPASPRPRAKGKKMRNLPQTPFGRPQQFKGVAFTKTAEELEEERLQKEEDEIFAKRLEVLKFEAQERVKVRTQAC